MENKLNEEMRQKEQERMNEINEHLANAEDDSPRLYVGTYGKYNAGSIKGEWIDLTTFADAYDFIDFCCNVLHADEDDPELMFQDYDNFPASLYSECMDEDELQRIWDWWDLSEDERDMCEEYWNDVDSNADPSDIKDKCVWHSGDIEEYAESIVDDCMDIPDNIRPYFNMELFARDLSYDYHITDNFIFTAY